MKVYPQGEVRAGYLISFVFLFLCVLLTLITSVQLLQQSKKVNHSNEVLTNVSHLLSYIKDGEIGARGYIITNNPTFLQPYLQSIHKTDSAINLLLSLTEKDLLQQQHVKTVQQLVQEKKELQTNALSFFNNTHTITEELVRKVDVGKRIMDSIRFTIWQMENHEQSLIAKKKKDVDDSYTRMIIVSSASLILAVFLSFYSASIQKKESRTKAELNKQLEERIIGLENMNEEMLNLKSVEKFVATGRVASAIAHEVRNPLTNISLAVDQLSHEIEKNEENKLLIGMIQRNADRINQLIVNLLNATKSAQLEYVKTSIHNLLDAALELAKDRIELNHITVVKNYAPFDCKVLVDETKMKVAILNIIINAIEAMEPEKGILTIQTKKWGNECMISIADNGCGMSKETAQHIFDAYFTGKRTGNGLGLTNTQNVIIAHKGKIYVESEESKGTTFTIILNLAD